MRAGKTEDAVVASALVGNTGRRRRRAFGVVQAKFKTGRGISGAGGQREPAKRDEEGLGCDGIGDNDADQRPPQVPAQSAK
jgi:hypothetical protein